MDDYNPYTWRVEPKRFSSGYRYKVWHNGVLIGKGSRYGHGLAIDDAFAIVKNHRSMSRQAAWRL